MEIDINRVRDQNDRMHKWFKERTRIGGFLYEQMNKIDEILSTTLAARDGECEHEIVEDEFGLDVVLISCTGDALWYDRDKLFWVYCPFCGGKIKIIEESENE